MAGSFLDNILEYKRGLIKEKAAFYASLQEKVGRRKQGRQFKKAVSQPGQVNLIAEIKKASPSKGLIREDFDPLAIARVYARAGAAALSVLTEDKFFLGEPEFIKEIRADINIPILTKDFIIDKGQIYEACFNGADAVLLIVAILGDGALKGLIDVASRLGLETLVEVHNEKELERACAAGAEIIGVNNRDLRTFVVDMDTTKRVAPKIPKGKVIVAESGYENSHQIEELKGLGVNAVLIGGTFMRAPDIGRKVKEIMGDLKK
jgi:indole-3-glycerol phosphate synthase